MKTTVYLILEPKWSSYQVHRSGPYTGEKVLSGVSVSGMRMKQPENPPGVVVKLEIEIGDAAFYPWVPSVPVVVPVALPKPPTVAVAPVTPVKGRKPSPHALNAKGK